METNRNGQISPKFNEKKRKQSLFSDSEDSDSSCEIIPYLGKLNKTFDESSDENGREKVQHKKFKGNINYNDDDANESISGKS